MPRAPADLSRIPGADLLYAIAQLIAAGKTTSAEVQRLAGQRSARVAAIQDELKALQAGQPRGGAPGRGPDRPPGERAVSKPAAKPKRTFTMTPKALAARKLQGLYLGRLRKLKGADRAKVKAVAKKDGVADAVKTAETLLR